MVIVLDRDIVSQAYYPSITFLQNTEWLSQAILDLNDKPKCFIGWMDEDNAACSEVIPGEWCNCGSNWGTTIEIVQCGHTTYRALSLYASQYTVCVQPTTTILTQAFFSYDSYKAKTDSFITLLSSIWLAIYDTTLTLEEALEGGYSRLNLINAYAMTSVNLVLNYRQAPGKAPAYDYYEFTISSVPANDLTCDASGNFYGDCHISLILQFSTFERQISRLRYEMSWTDVAAAAASWLSLFQIVSWILSGSALQFK
ncbi:uncharacterized protein BCR38DRAFT_508557 [Pseudomassariella vexata]|uniref:Uncharacterized protein n=1 Tax=Pseudomassariella vexata TaxID=1141098 RepID=A0A1Y2ECE5_9PEZI|nr:uncharacterized protein BCR38DRAFT_508557 [Pseudomassariella vexata]ORY69077.1 hypothetical protein BCR38DRAFT_508557 [Pseudomassariella vexata]